MPSGSEEGSGHQSGPPSCPVLYLVAKQQRWHSGLLHAQRPCVGNSLRATTWTWPDSDPTGITVQPQISVCVCETSVQKLAHPFQQGDNQWVMVYM